MADVWRRERVEYAAGVGAIAIATTLAALDAWPFDGARVARADAPIWEELVYHGAVLGFLRLAVVAPALYGIASVPALIVGGRWAKGLGTTGITADDARWAVDATMTDVARRMDALRRDNEELVRTRDDLLRLLDDETTPE